MAVALEQFAKQLSDSGVVAPGKLENFLPPKAHPKDAQELARQLVQCRHLTKFQAQEIYQGRAKSLILGNYTILDKIGAGGMGQVFKAEHRRMKRIVAIKMLPRNLTRDAASVARFQREAEAAAKLRHPNIVAADDADEAGGVHFLVMEYVAGSDLSALVKKHGPLSVAKALNYVLQAAHGLEFAHKKGVIHRDVKPGNLLLDTEGTVKILDMGLARLSADGDAKTQAELTGTGAVMGTVDYMAPEQALDTKHADARADIYSLGCTLYYLLTGRPAYEGDTLMAKLLAHREAPIPSLGAGVPEQVQAIFEKMAAKNVADRYQTMSEVVAALQQSSSARQTSLSIQPSVGTGSSSDVLTFLRNASLNTIHKPKPGKKGAGAKAGKNDKFIFGTIAAAFLGLAILAGIIFKMQTKDGTLVVEVNQPDAVVQVINEEGKVEITRPGEKGTISISVDPGKHRLKVEKDGFQFFTKDFTMESGGKQSIKAVLEPLKVAAMPAIAPFDAATARKHQEAWAKHLGLPVEIANSIGMKLVLIPPGEFRMGSSKELIEADLKAHANDRWYKDHLPDEGPQHRVRITRPFYLGMYVVTQQEYQRVIGTNPSEFSATGKGKDKVGGQDTKRFPVDNVSWDNAVEFCRKLSQMPEEKAAGRAYRLPSEAQWEYACRAESAGRYSFSLGGNAIPRESDENELSDFGWFKGNSGGIPHAVGGKRPSAWGLYDMQGNVWEWCQDWYDKDYYANSPADDPSGPPWGSHRIHRGGSWNHPAGRCRCALRDHNEPGTCHYDLGFRVSQVLADKTDGRETVPSAESSVPSTQVPAPIPIPKSSIPPLAIAPFDEKKAKEHQEAWAKHLGLPVEINNSIGMKLVLIPAGEFMMGSAKELVEEDLKAHGDDQWYKDHLPGEGPQHRVRITRPFYLGMTEVMQGEFKRVMGTNPSWFCATGKLKDAVAGQDTKRFPVGNVSWDDAVEFCRELSDLPEEAAAGRTYRLPSEAQWEYACRAGSRGRYGFISEGKAIPKESYENELSDYGWFGGNAGGITHAVGLKRASGWGLYDMHGNVWEWCQDRYDQEYYAKSPVDDPGGPPGGSYRVLRGGSFCCLAALCRSACRCDCAPGDGHGDFGFRVSLVLPDTAPERAKMSRASDAAQPSGGSIANKPSPAVANPDSQSSVRLPVVGSLVGADGKWKLPPGAPSPAVAPFDEKKAKEHQEGWAKHLGLPVEMTNSIGMKLVLVPPGEFEMGSPKELIEEELKRPGIEDWYLERLLGEGPQHRVRITRPFYLGAYSVTQQEYQRIMGGNPSEFSATGKSKDKVAGQDTKRFPIEFVSWDDAVEFCRKLSEMPEEKSAGHAYRLPSEAQWEYACRAGNLGRWSFSAQPNPLPAEEKLLGAYAWFRDNAGGMTHPVGKKWANAWGLYDMHGNVWGWCQDWYDRDYYTNSPTDDPAGPSGGPDRVFRGSGWIDFGWRGRAAIRSHLGPRDCFNFLGFRVSLVLADK